MYLSAHQTHVLARVMTTLAEPHAERDIREQVGRLMLELLGAQFYASFVWDAEASQFDACVQIDMDPANLQRYERYYQFHDPITPQLQRHRQAVCVTEVMPQAELKRTEFFNDFLFRDGLYWGINLYAWNGTDNIGDMRIWRDRKRENFSRNDVQLLDLVRPAFTAALARCRRDRPVVQPVHAAPSSGGLAATSAQPALSERERHVALLVAQGLADKEVAARLGISVTTVRTHIDHAFRKLDVNNRVALARRLSG